MTNLFPARTAKFVLGMTAAGAAFGLIASLLRANGEQGTLYAGIGAAAALILVLSVVGYGTIRSLQASTAGLVIALTKTRARLGAHECVPSFEQEMAGSAALPALRRYSRI
jgi:hypothetical protein